MSDFMTLDKALSLLVLCVGYIVVVLFLRWLKALDDDMPLPEPLPCANCGDIDAYPRIFYKDNKKEEAWVAYTCSMCPVQAPPISAEVRRSKYGGYRIDRESNALAIKLWNEIMEGPPPSSPPPPPFT